MYKWKEVAPKVWYWIDDEKAPDEPRCRAIIEVREGMWEWRYYHPTHSKIGHCYDIITAKKKCRAAHRMAP